MVSGQSSDAYKYDFNAKKFKVAFKFLERTDLADLPEGKIDLEEGVFAQIQHYTSIKRDEGFFETHEKYFDIQYVIEGEEMVGVCERDGMVVKTPYNTERDITFYHDPKAYGEVYLKSGDYITLTPEDVHKPRCQASGPCKIKKIVLKVPV